MRGTMNSRKTRLLFVPAAAALAAVLAIAAPQPSTGQEAAPATDLDELSQALTLQTAQIINHQTEIDARLERVEEMVRQARIYASRGGAAKR